MTEDDETRAQFSLNFETPDGQIVDVTVTHPKNNAMLGLQALREAASDHSRMQVIYSLRDEPSIGPLLVEWAIDFSDPATLAALEKFGRE